MRLVVFAALALRSLAHGTHAFSVPRPAACRRLSTARSTLVRGSAAQPDGAPGEDEAAFGLDADGELPAYRCSEAKITQTLGEASGAKLSERFMYAQRALSGEFSPPDDAADTETGTGLIGGLVNFPAELEFTVVAECAAEQDLLADLAAIARRSSGLMPTCTTAKPRGARFTSVRMRILVGSPDTARDLHAAFLAHPAVRFTF
ncbi:hypothetical protein KFE25_014200 [Diacronema lutheri]|uniref:Uncharacterized protein n=1 Tax=Diacronema lutheri TaxID=2081491 RepID=A0A7R9UZ01_DIALT|nr:hypothetical protein KFE25_014200 [Diacronema lutheri]|mmetsp:Transcript_7353/g.23209  ORF Transcript_7353/g.23209 Transcript_7353/m.23209 type:complete len:204 (+) Transcript_7353:467-1078(+)